MKISIIIPVFNEANTILQILKKIKEIKKINKEVIIINDGSTDDTKKIIEIKCKGLFNKLISYKQNRGKGYACRRGLKSVTGKIVIIQDADLEYDPKDYLKLLNPILKKKTNVVYGSRVLKGGVRIRPRSFDVVIRLSANHFLTFLSNILNNHNLTDAHTCYKVFKSNLIKKIKLYEDGFNFCPEITAQFSKINERIYEVPINYYGRTHDQGKKIYFSDGIKAIYALFKYNILR
tara:strand:- start:77 stop:778 length:702 start_codon:yes stop_codon:yes gene_type:complete